MKFINRLSTIVTVLTLTIGASAHAATALTSTRGTGNQSYTGALGMDFDVNSAILITSLGAFDSGLDGFNEFGIQVGIFDRGTGFLIGTSATISGEDPNQGQSRFVDIDDFVLGPGQYSIVAFGFSSLNQNGNSGLGGSGPTQDTGGGAISFIGSGRYDSTLSAGFSLPSTLDGGPTNRYDAGTFTFTTAVPEPGEWAMMLAGIGMIGLLARRRKATTSAN